MDSNEVVDLSSDDGDTALTRKETDRQKWNELKKYIPFLEYITKKDPEKNKTYTKLVHWLKIRAVYPARVAYMCETRIHKRYEKLKLSMDFPPHVVSAFKKIDAIVISDEDESQDLEEGEKSTKAKSKVRDNAGLFEKNSSASSVPNRKTVDVLKVTVQSVASSSKNSDKSKQENVANRRSCPLQILEDGELLSDNEGGSSKKLSKSDDASRTKGAKLPKTTETPDDILNNELFKRIDSLTEDGDGFSRNGGVSVKALQSTVEVHAQKSPVLQQNNLERELPRRRSPLSPLRSLLSPVSDEDESSKTDTHRKKKKKKKKKSSKNKSHRTSDWYISEAENADSDRSLKQKIYRRDCYSTGNDDKTVKRSKCDKTQKEKSRPLYVISDDDDDDANEEETANKSPNITVPDSQLFQRRDPDRDTVVLLDSDEDEQPQGTVATQPPSPETALTISAVPKADVTPISDNKSVLNPCNIRDLNNMDLEELSDVYSKLCQTTGIQLEELLSDLVTKSTNVEEQAPLVCGDKFNQIDIISDNSNSKNNNDMMCIKADFEQQHNQKLEQQNLLLQQQQQELLQRQQQHHQQQMQQADQMLCNVPQPQPYTYQNSFLLGLNLKDPRIVQKLRQIQDSPIYNLGTRESAKILVNLHSACAQRRPNPIAKVTAKTATTYGEHKRLRELEKQKKLERDNADKCALVIRDHMASDQASPSAKRYKPKRSNSAESGSGKETPKERKRAISSGSESGQKTPKSGEKDARMRTNSSGSEGGRKTPKSNEKRELKRKNSAASEEGQATPKSTENAKPMRKHSSGSESGKYTHKPTQSETEKDNEDIKRRSFSLNRSKTLRIESDDSSDEDASLPTTSAVSPLKMEKVVDIVLSAINKSKKNAKKALSNISRTNSMIESTHSNESNQQPTVAVSKVCVNERIQAPTAEEGHIPGGQRERPKGIDQSASTPKTNNLQKRGCRELNNLNCTFKDYREMFEKNWLPTLDGKRRCIAPTGSMMEPQLNQSEENLCRANDNSNDIFEPQPKTTAAPIKRRRQTCSALQRPSSPEKIQLPPLKVVIRRLSAGGTFGVEESPRIANASDDTDEFDVEEHRKPTASKRTNPILKLRKLSQNDIEELKSAEKTNRKNRFDYSKSTSDSMKQGESSKNPKGVELNRLSVSSSESTLFVESTPPEMPILVPYTSKLVDNPTKTVTKPRKYSNVDIGMTLSSTKTCTLCNKRPLDLTNHYVVQHKTESYVSRLSSAEIEDLEANITLAVPYRKRYKVVCVFCQDELEDQFVCFHDHYSYHTGEYAYKCDVCELVKPYRPDVRSHQLRTSRCRNGKIRIDYRYKQELTVIYLYVCKLCNFVQLNEANIHKHHRDHHGFRFDEPQHVKKCIIAAVDSTEVANEVMPSNSQEDNFAEESESVSAADSETGQAQEFVHEHPLDIKDILLTEDGQTGENHTIKLEGYEVSPSLSLFESLLDDMHRDNDTLESEPVASPEVLLEQLHCSQTSSSVMTVVHSNTTSIPVTDNHKPYVDPVDVKPNVKDIQIEAPAAVTPSAKVKPTQNRPRIYRSTTSESGYFGMYKCMFQDCWFSTNMDTRFIEHTSSHASNLSFRCAYCGSKNSSAEKLVRHVRSRHSMSRYQCSDCTYRSIIPGNVSIHRGLRHNDSDKAKGIYECVFRLKTKEERVLALQNKLINNISSLKCPDCSSTYYAVSSMKLHIQTEHPQSFDTLDMSMFNEFACLHCKTESNSKESMQIHLATVHPDEMGYVAERKLKSYASQDSIENISMVNISKPIMPLDIHLAEFVEPDPEPKVAATNEQPLLKECLPQLAEGTFNGQISIPSEKEQPKNIEIEPAASTPVCQVAVHTTTQEEDLLCERMKLLLDLLTENTGINQSVLYRCTQCTASFFKYEFWLSHITSRHSITEVISCPYCSQQLPLDSVVPHFENHSRHQYFCLHCIKTFCSHDQVQKHFTRWHKDCPTFSEKKLKTGLRSYFIVHKQDVPVVDWLPVYKVMSDEIRANLIARLQENTRFEWWGGLDLACLEEIQIPQFIKFGQYRYKCLVKSCSFLGLDENQLDSHLITHTVPRQYKCSHCALKLSSPSWADMKNHKMLHKDDVYICCVCKYVHHNRFGITKHIESLHNSRDVPVITMWRDERNYKTSLSIVLTSGRTGFTTTAVCFCCEKPMKNNSELLLHLKTQHKIKMCPKCAQCDKVLITQADAEEHSREHGPQVFKLRYDILATTLHNLNVKSMAPFSIEIKPIEEKRTSEEDEEFSLKKVKLEDEIIIKTERDEDVDPDNADNSQLLEGAIKCVNINNLVQNVNASTSQEVNRRPEVGRILVKPTAALQMPAQYAGCSPASYQPAQGYARTTSVGMHQTTPEQVVANIQLPNYRGTAVVSVPSLATYPMARPFLPTVLPGTPTSNDLCIAHYSRQMNLPIPNFDSTLDGPHDARTCNCPVLPEIAVTCKHCMKECTDFCELRTHYDAVHAPKKQRFLFRIARKVECMHCPHRCSLLAIMVHHVTFHPNSPRMCRSVVDRTRCGYCNMVFDFLPTSDRPICGCPMNQRVLADCLDLKTFKALQMYGVKSYKMTQANNEDSFQKLELIKTISYLCNMCDRMETSLQQIIEHYRNSHIKSNEPFASRLNLYKKIGIIYPRGLILAIGDGDPQTYNYEYFKLDIARIEAQMQPPFK